MSTIPSTSDEYGVPYTIVGGEKSDRSLKKAPPVSLLLLNRGGKPFRYEYFKELEQLGDLEIISVEPGGKAYDVEALSHKFPRVRFLLMRQDSNRGEQINIGMKEAAGLHVFVFWNDMKISSPLTASLVRRITEERRLCTVPIIQNTRMETVPSIPVPAFHKKNLKVLPMLPHQSGVESLYPFDYCGLYNRERFLLTGGYDHTLNNSYWQKMDFGFRAHMWGESIECDTSLRVRYLSEPPAEDSTPDESYKRFFLKNLSVRWAGDCGALPWGRFFPYYLRSGSPLLSALREFREVRRWVGLNKFRFVRDARSVTELWEAPE